MFGGVGTVGEDAVDHQEHQAKRQRERRLVLFNGEGRKRCLPVAVEAAVRGLAIAESSRVNGGTGKGDRSTGKRRTESCLRSEHRALDSSAGHWIIRARDGGTQADIARVSHASSLSLKKV